MDGLPMESRVPPGALEPLRLPLEFALRPGAIGRIKGLDHTLRTAAQRLA